MNYIIIILLILCISFFVIKNNYTISDEVFISFGSTEQLKGLAIIFVIISHLILVKFININIHPMEYSGAYGVSIFLVLSGYGLSESYKKDMNLKNFFVKRLKKVILPYSLVTTVWILIDKVILAKVYSWNDLMLAIIGFDFKRIIDSSMWYITFILIWYIVFYITFKLPLRNILKVSILFLCAYIFNKHSNTGYTKSIAYQFMLHSYTFPIGVVLSLYLKKWINNLKTKWLAIIVPIFVVFLLIIYKYTLARITEKIDFYSINSIMVTLILISIFILLSLVRIKSKLLAYLGSLSYELYLFEFVFLTKYPILTILSNKMLSIVVYISILIVLSYILKYGIEKFIKWNKDGLIKDYS